MSPIEDMLASRLLPVLAEFCWRVRRQVRFGRYTADFVIEADDEVTLIVECDGFEFHDRTKEQAARDRRRDRLMLAAGYPTIRFTGSEIHRDGAQCVADIIHVIDELRRTRVDLFNRGIDAGFTRGVEHAVEAMG